MMPRPSRGPSGLGLRPRAGGLGSQLRALFGRPWGTDEETWDHIEELLIAADVGAETTLALVAATRQRVGSSSSGSGSSKSSLTEMAPGCRPATRGLLPEPE